MGLPNFDISRCPCRASPTWVRVSNHEAVPREGASLYILRCADGKLYTGLTRREIEERVSEHQQGLSAFTKTRLPVQLIFSEHYALITDAIEAERRIKGWSRVKKLAYVAGDFRRLSAFAQRRS